MMLFSALRPFAEKYPVRFFASLFSFNLFVFSMLRKDDLVQGNRAEIFGDLVVASLVLSVPLYIFIRYVTRNISSSNDE